MKDNKKRIEHEESYVDFLSKKLKSDNFKTNVTKDEYKKTKRKYDKAKLILKMLKEGKL